MGNRANVRLGEELESEEARVHIKLGGIRRDSREKGLGGNGRSWYDGRLLLLRLGSEFFSRSIDGSNDLWMAAYERTFSRVKWRKYLYLFRELGFLGLDRFFGSSDRLLVLDDDDGLIGNDGGAFFDFRSFPNDWYSLRRSFLCGNGWNYLRFWLSG